RVLLENPALSGVSCSEKWFFANGNFARRVQLEYGMDEKRIAYSALAVVFPKDFRAPGLYETWGTGHTMQHKFASEVAFDFPALNNSTLVFENPREKTAILAYRHRYNDEYTHLGASTGSVELFDSRATVFTATGFRLSDGIWLLDRPGSKGAVTTHVLVAPGDVTQAFDRYLAQNEVREYYSAIKRPEWLKMWRMYISQGWDGLFGTNGKRYVEHMASLIREGHIVYGAWDSDFNWGDFPVSGDVRNLFGGRMSADGMRERNEAIHRSVPNAKIWQYTWLWSTSKTSELFQKHPEWFITKDVDGKELSFFPGCGINYTRLVSIPESADELVDSLTRFINRYGHDIWYLDGGGSSATVDWYNMRMNPPDAWDRVLRRVRTAIQKDNPQRSFFCNNPQYPVADFGFLESFGGLITTNWRDGATWMMKFKLWQRADSLVNPLYIYWLPGAVDTAYRQYAVGIGLGLAFGGSSDRRLDAALISAWHQSRWAKLVNANLMPNWRHAPSESLEAMPLTFGASGWLFLKNHEAGTIRQKVSADAAPLGLTVPDRPIHHWCFSLRDHKLHKGLLGEPERESNYRASRWASDFIVEPEYLGSTPWSKRVERTFELPGNQLKLWYVTQTPAVVYSVDELRNQLWLDDTLGVRVSGAFAPQGDLELEVSSERTSAEIAALIPKEKTVRSVTVNGQAVHYNLAADAGTRLVLIPVSKGQNGIRVNYAEAESAPPADYRLTVQKSGKILELSLTPAVENALLAVTNAGDMVWSKTGANAKIAVPSGVTGGTYSAAAYDAAGKKLAEAQFDLKQGVPKVGRWTFLAPQKQISDSGDGWHSSVVENSGTATADPARRTVRLEVNPMPSTHWGYLAAGFECDLKRYAKIRLKGNLWYFCINGIGAGGKKMPHIRWENPAAFFGLVIDFADGSGEYVKRVLAGTGGSTTDRFKGKKPAWGAQRVPDVIASVSDFAVSGKQEEVFWLDLKELGAPATWNGKVYFSLLWSMFKPDRHFQAEILETTEQLPQNASVAKPYFVRGGKNAELRKVELPRGKDEITIDGKGDEPVWQNAPILDTFYRLNAAGIKAPATKVRLFRDERFLYLLAELQEPAEKGFTGPSVGKVWFADGIELYIRNRDSKTAFTHFIWSVTGDSYQEWCSDSKVGSPRQKLASVECRTRIDEKTAWIEAAIPITVFGDGEPTSRFNIGRNRMVDGNLENYSLAGGKGYLNFEAFELIW
ncbi:MAG: hypothetical protein IJJ33_04385, partial [Victivallales bacterium]|nr:hypothetical protein [Victivallales bacterium]